MAFNKKASETGWFYHAPAKASPSKEPVGAPPPSQIPGLDGNQDHYEEPPKQYIKESDSPYIRMAKQGGRPNLLQIAENKPRTDGPKGYPRCEWYYDDEIPDESTSPKEQYQFLLPDYMVHPDGPKDDGDQAYAAKRLPYGYDTTTVYDREGKHCADKTVRLPEVTKPGYGVRQNRPSSYSKKAPVTRTQACKPPSPQIGAAQKFKPMPVRREEERPPMNKLLSFGYLDDWQKDREAWSQRQEKIAEANRGPPAKPEKHLSEYQESLAAKSKPTDSTKPTQRKSSSHSTSSQYRKMKPEDDKEKPDFFKMSKFKNVPSKTDSHRVQHGSPALSTQTVVPPVAN